MRSAPLLGKKEQRQRPFADSARQLCPLVNQPDLQGRERDLAQQSPVLQSPATFRSTKKSRKPIILRQCDGAPEWTDFDHTLYIVGICKTPCQPTYCHLTQNAPMYDCTLACTLLVLRCAVGTNRKVRQKCQAVRCTFKNFHSV